MYALVVAFAGLVMGKRLFAGPALSATGPMWSYGYLTMIVILAPAVMDSAGGSEAGAAFWSRLVMFAGATVYSVIAVTVFDAFFSARSTKIAERLRRNFGIWLVPIH